MTKHERVLNGLETLATHEKQRLSVTIEQFNGQWVVKFQTLDVAVQMTLEAFVAVPDIVIEPFTESLIKAIR